MSQGAPPTWYARVFWPAGVLPASRAPEPEVPRNIGLVHSDPCFYVIDKPAGLPIHPTGRYHFSTLTAVLRERFPGSRCSARTALIARPRACCWWRGRRRRHRS